MDKKIICVLGLGYIGLPTASLLACKGHIVNGVDVNPDVVNTINQGKIHIVEPDLDRYVKLAIESGNLIATEIPQKSDVYIICVPTPFSGQDDNPIPNIDYVVDAAKSIAPLLQKNNMVILESTCPIGTTDEIKTIFDNMGVETSSIDIAYCPERVLPGNIMEELTKNDRIVGGIDNKSSASIAEFYKTFVTGDVVSTNARTAEMCKLTENSFRDVNIAFANELSIICEANGVNIWDLVSLANKHPRVNILQPGPGVGGHCIAVDPWFLIAGDTKNSRLIRLGREINDSKTIWVIDQITLRASEMALQLKRKITIACFGITFKPNIDDLRQSPALKVAMALLERDLDVVVVDPNIKSHDLFNIVRMDSSFKICDLVVMLVPHNEFKNPLIIERILQKETLDFVGLLAER